MNLAGTEYEIADCPIFTAESWQISLIYDLEACIRLRCLLKSGGLNDQPARFAKAIRFWPME